MKAKMDASFICTHHRISEACKPAQSLQVAGCSWDHLTARDLELGGESLRANGLVQQHHVVHPWTYRNKNSNLPFQGVPSIPFYTYKASLFKSCVSTYGWSGEKLHLDEPGTL
eukprot:1139764-Pelagomonas_calceolata.AAC.1